MVNRRTVTFGSLVLALAPAVARASEEAREAAGDSLVPELGLSRAGQQLLVDLRVHNAGQEPVDLLVAYGSRPGPHLQAFLQLDGEELELVREVELDRREVMSRAGPRPRWAPLAAGKRVDVGRYTFTLPQGVEREQVAIVGQLSTMTGEVAFRRDGLTWKGQREA